MDELQGRNHPVKPLRDERGRMLAPLPGGAPPITPDNARQMVQKRVEKYRRAALKRIVDEAKSVDLTVSTAADAYGLVAAKQYVALMDSEKPRIADLEKLGQIMTGADSRRENTPETPQNGVIAATPDTLLDLLDEIERRKSAAVDKARAIDADVTG